jgi:hypothetical protein
VAEPFRPFCPWCGTYLLPDGTHPGATQPVTVAAQVRSSQTRRAWFWLIVDLYLLVSGPYFAAVGFQTGLLVLAFVGVLVFWIGVTGVIVNARTIRRGHRNGP